MDNRSSKIEWSGALFKRLCDACNAKTQRDLAAFLGITEGTLSGHKTAKTFPEKLLRRAADKAGVDYDYLATGQPPFRAVRMVSGEEAARAVRWMGLPKEVREEFDRVTHTMREWPSTIVWLDALLKILTSDSAGSKLGIQENLNAFLARLGHPELPTELTKKEHKARAPG